MSDLLTLAYARALAAADPGLLQLSFGAAVLDRYLSTQAYQVMRTDTVGRVRKQGAWTLDFGIAPGEATLHASWTALAHALPADERAHWALHAAPLSALSDMFLRMQLSPGSCFDDGPLRSW
ncbi:MAG: hypothetical protein HYX50_05895 [Chloroflexi bacterium]|nr:hypothetical protein [Chloroflexota bacterium]